MNRTLVIGGLAALAVLLGLGSWLLIRGHGPGTPSSTETTAAEGPMAINPVSIISKAATTEDAAAHKLNIVFSDFELRGSGRDAPDVHCFGRAPDDARGLRCRPRLIPFVSSCTAHSLVASRMLRCAVVSTL